MKKIFKTIDIDDFDMLLKSIIDRLTDISSFDEDILNWLNEKVFYKTFTLTDSKSVLWSMLSYNNGKGNHITSNFCITNEYQNSSDEEYFKDVINLGSNSNKRIEIGQKDSISVFLLNERFNPDKKSIFFNTESLFGKIKEGEKITQNILQQLWLSFYQDNEKDAIEFSIKYFELFENYYNLYLASKLKYNGKYSNLYYYFIVSNDFSNRISKSLLIFCTKNKLKNNQLGLLKLITQFVFSKDVFIKLKQSQIKSAIAAIMSRNMSHNIGSHVITNTKAHIERLAHTNTNIQPDLLGLSKLMHYIQERQDFISVLAAGEQYAKGPVNLKNHIFDYIAYDGPPSRHNSSRITNFFLDNIVKSEDFTRDSTGKGLKRIELRMKDEKHELYSLTSNGEEAKSLSKINFAIPYGINGRQAFLSIIENIIRNSAKHRKEFIEKNELLITLEIENETYVDFTINIYDNKGHFNEVISNINRAKKILVPVDTVKNEYKIKQGALKIYNEDGTLNHENKGIKEMLICIAWMKGFSDYSVLEEDTYEKLGVCFKSIKSEKDSFAISFKLGKYLPKYEISIKQAEQGSTKKFKIKDSSLNIDNPAEVSEYIKSLPAAEIYVICDINGPKSTTVDTDSALTELYRVLQCYLPRVVLVEKSGDSTIDESTYFNECFKNQILPYYQSRIANKEVELNDAFDFPLVTVDQKEISTEHLSVNKECNFIYSLQNSDLMSGNSDAPNKTRLKDIISYLRKDIIKVIEDSGIKYREQEFQYFLDSLSLDIDTNESNKQDSDLIKSIIDAIKSRGYQTRKKPGFVLFKNHYEVLDKDKSFISLEDNKDCLFLEGISGGNYTHTLIRNSDFTRKHFIKIIESSLTRVSIIDERLFLKFRDPAIDNDSFNDQGFFEKLDHAELKKAVIEILTIAIDGWNEDNVEIKPFNDIQSDEFSERIAKAIIDWGKKNNRFFYPTESKTLSPFLWGDISTIISNLDLRNLSDTDSKKIVDCAFIQLVNEDKPVKPKNMGTYFVGKNIFIYTIQKPEEIILEKDRDCNFNLLSAINSSVNLKTILDTSHFISIHYSLIEKLKLQENHSKPNELNAAMTKLRLLFNAYRGKLAVHSGRGELNNFDKDSVAFLPLSSIEWALENSKFMLTELFYNLKYYPNGD